MKNTSKFPASLKWIALAGGLFLLARNIKPAGALLVGGNPYNPQKTDANAVLPYAFRNDTPSYTSPVSISNPFGLY